MIRSTLLEMKCEFLGLLRMPRYSVMTITFPAMFYVFFGIIIHQGDLGGISASTYALTIMSVFGVMFASLMGLGAGIAAERGLGWLEVKRASPMPAFGWFAAKLSTAMLFSAIVSGVVFALGAAFGGVRMGLTQWLVLWSAMVLGSIPFATLGFVLGYLASSNSAPAMVNIVAMPMAFLSGLFVPVQFMPKFVQHIAPAMPAFHLARIGQAIVGMQGSDPVFLTRARTGPIHRVVRPRGLVCVAAGRKQNAWLRRAYPRRASSRFCRRTRSRAGCPTCGWCTWSTSWCPRCSCLIWSGSGG